MPRRCCTLGHRGRKVGALVDVLFSDGPQATNPSGRPPYTVAKAGEDFSADVLYSSTMQTPQITYEEGLNIDYRYPYSAIILSTPCWSDGFFVLQMV